MKNQWRSGDLKHDAEQLKHLHHLHKYFYMQNITALQHFLAQFKLELNLACFRTDFFDMLQLQNK